MLDVRDLRVSYGPVQALAGISLEVREGEIVALIGANGAGKSSLIHAVAGLAPAAGGKVALAHNLGEPVPDGWLIDSRGRPTNDPGVILEDPPGSLLPLGGPVGYKGFGLGLAVEALAGALSGAGCTDWDRIRGGNAVFLNVINVASFARPEIFHAQMQGFLERIKASPRAPGFDEIRIPGEREARERQRRRREGIVLPRATWREVLAVANDLGLDLENHEDESS